MNNNWNTINYTYDTNNNIETITQNSNLIKYYYNEINELIREDNQILAKTITYSYDTGGNFTGKIEYPYTTGIPSNPTKTYTYGYDSIWKDKLANFDGRTITYDGAGNPLSDGIYTYTWEEGRQLNSVSGNGNNISYKYNDAGIRTEKTVNGITTKYHLVDNKVTYQTDGTDKMYFTYDSEGNLVSMVLGTAVYYYIRNAQGDITGLFDNAGTQVVSYTYDTWGKLISITGSKASTLGVKNPYRYRGYRYDTETGLYYLQSRYYNPEWGRFVNADDTLVPVLVKGELLTANLFIYSGNNPVNNIDEDGFIWGSIVKGIVKKVVKEIVKQIVKKEAKKVVKKTINELIKDIKENPKNWKKTGEKIEDSTNMKNKGGKSIENEYTNKKTSDKIYEHILKDKNSKVIDQHYRPYSK